MERTAGREGARSTRHGEIHRASTSLLTPARVVLARAETENAAAGHENLGFLSAAHGFLPTAPPRRALSPAFAPWDEAAAELPFLHRSLRLRAALDALPTLDAGPSCLPAAELLRAAHLLAMLAHAYHYVETQPPPALPRALAAPWAVVRERLGRPDPVLSYVDLVVYNFALRDPEAADPLSVENLRLLTPTVDTQEERVFYLTQTEILGRAAPIVEAVVRAQEAVRDDDEAALERELASILACVEAMQRSLRKIAPRTQSETQVHPVAWAKAVAPFAVPMTKGLQGPSGTSSPVFNLLDTFLERPRHDTFLGREIRDLRRGYPPFWRQFLEAVAASPSVPAHVASRGTSPARALLGEVMAAYAGEEGFLGQHRRKVYGYLELAFKVGRSLTIGGFAGEFHDRTWDQVDDELEASRRERPGLDRGASSAGVTPFFVRPSQTPNPARVELGPRPSELIGRNEGSSCWVVVDDEVYDLGAFLPLHPGGEHVLRLYAGMDASQAFARAHRGADLPRALLQRYRLGQLRHPSLSEEDIAFEAGGQTRRVSRRGLYLRWLRFSYLVVEMENAHRLDLTRPGLGTTPPAPYDLQRSVERQARFLASYLAGCVGPLFRELAVVTEGLCFGRSSGFLEAAATSARARAESAARDAALAELRECARHGGDDENGLAARRLERACAGADLSGAATLAAVKALLREGLAAFERHEELVLERARAVLPSLLARVPGLVEAHVTKARDLLTGIGACSPEAPASQGARP